MTLLPSLSVFCAPLRYVQGAGATLAIGREMLAVGLQGPALFVAGPTAIEQLAPTWAIAMEEIHWTHRVRVFAGESSRREIQAIVAEAANLKARVIVGAGGGKVLDAARAAAAATQIGFVSCPTICSTDAPTSALSVIYSENRAAHGAAEVEMYEIHKRSPDLVLVDTRVIAQSPSRFLAAGIGDAMSTFYEARAVVTAGKPNMRGGLSTLAAFELSRLCRDTVLAHGEAAMADCCNQTESKSLALVVEAATLLSGLGFESAGLAAAHAVHNGLTSIPSTHGMLHGEKVAFGTLVQLVLEAQSHASDPDTRANANQEALHMADFLNRIGLPITLTQLHVPDSAVVRVAERSVAPGETIHNMPFPVDALSVAAAIRAAHAMGQAILLQSHAGSTIGTSQPQTAP